MSRSLEMRRFCNCTFILFYSGMTLLALFALFSNVFSIYASDKDTEENLDPCFNSLPNNVTNATTEKVEANSWLTAPHFLQDAIALCGSLLFLLHAGGMRIHAVMRFLNSLRTGDLSFIPFYLNRAKRTRCLPSAIICGNPEFAAVVNEFLSRDFSEVNDAKEASPDLIRLASVKTLNVYQVDTEHGKRLSVYSDLERVRALDDYSEFSDGVVLLGLRQFPAGRVDLLPRIYSFRKGSDLICQVSGFVIQFFMGAIAGVYSYQKLLPIIGLGWSAAIGIGAGLLTFAMRVSNSSLALMRIVEAFQTPDRPKKSLFAAFFFQLVLAYPLSIFYDKNYFLQGGFRTIADIEPNICHVQQPLEWFVFGFSSLGFLLQSLMYFEELLMQPKEAIKKMLTTLSRPWIKYPFFTIVAVDTAFSIYFSALLVSNNLPHMRSEIGSLFSLLYATAYGLGMYIPQYTPGAVTTLSLLEGRFFPRAPVVQSAAADAVAAKNDDGKVDERSRLLDHQH